ncbi:LLM class flavin-dependent oxidoreductase [Mesorhizobium sp.]|uniref:LLM class flavin-dependent oxidoreductase n=1 Tax=Mesorhizobium sp. TaxID=1871066 RepID=UPI000FEA5EE2|nr:LLM class flavin-dependent oxidoreductase [Mesorhizobium sp.]RWE00071.1 MAG: LLM class flavin-dependent oxidoreductase [Mesorhizobium sp.]
MPREMHLVGYCCVTPTWHNNGAWRHFESDGIEALNPERYENIARKLERGKFDGMFFVDVLMLNDMHGGSFAPNLRQPGQTWMLEPMQLLSAIARVTTHLGLSATMSTSFYHPYHIARSFATLDHMSGGRAAWNIVTSTNDNEARNFGKDALLDKAVRYDFADEVVEACQALWRSWDEGALIHDRENGIYADPSKVHYANYEGKFVRTRGPLTTPRSPQTSPVLMQAGSSDRGRQFAARWAEVVFTLHADKAHMKAFYDDLKGRVVEAGRDPGHCAILPGIDVVIGETESIAREKADYINSLVSAELGVAEISNAIGVDLSQYPLDKPLHDMEITQGARGMLDLILQGARDKTLRDAGYIWGVRQMAPQVVGTPAMIADFMQEYFEADACDGFIISPSLSPTAYAQFVAGVVPELQRRGIFRNDYRGRTFRENLRDHGGG